MAQIKACIFSFFMRNIPQEAIMAQRAVVAKFNPSAAGRLSAARAAAESRPPPQRTAVTEPDMMRMLILAEVAARTDDRTLLQQMVNDARDA
jgi:hypothetical protein